MAEPSWEIVQGDALERLVELAPESVQTVVTSPPYWGLRDYGTATWEGGDPGCDHRHETEHQRQGATSARAGRSNIEAQRNENFRGTCPRCGAERVDAQLGLGSLDDYIADLVAVFAEVKRVLRPDGTLWLNLGDSYTSGGRDYRDPGRSDMNGGGRMAGLTEKGTRPAVPTGLKPKDLVGVPWRVAFALQGVGWYLRSDIIWAKPNPMPESVTDRPTRAHEYLFLLTKAERYYYDADAISEAAAASTAARAYLGARPLSDRQRHMQQAGMHGASDSLRDYARSSRNRRSVWEIATAPYPEAHFATFPPALVEPCIRAGSSPKACGVCGAPWRRVVERGEQPPEPEHRQPTKRLEPGQAGNVDAGNMGFRASRLSGQEMAAWRDAHPDQTVGWEPTCDHDDDSGLATVLDPFAGAGTTGVVALRLGRSFVGVELSAEYCELARTRIRDDAPLFNVAAERPGVPSS